MGEVPMKTWVHQVRALTATMVELRADRSRLERRCWELRGDMPEGGAAFMQLSGLSHAEVMTMAVATEAGVESPELRQVEAELRRIDETLAALDRSVREIVSAAESDGQAAWPKRPRSESVAANVVPFRPRLQPVLVRQELIGVA